MPELPEAETIRCQLEAEVKGRTILQLELNDPRAWRAHDSPQALAELVEGRRIVGVGRRGKAPYLMLDGKRPSVLVFRLGMTGLVRVAKAGESGERPAASLVLSGGRRVHFYDQRKFGQLVAYPGRDVDATREFAHYGPEPLRETFTREYLAGQLRRRSAKLEEVLMNQQVIAGIGKIYADEICFRAGVRPGRRASGLTRAMAERLHRAIPEVLKEGIECRGSSTRDETYRDVYGIPGRFQERMMVYQRTGQPCRVCGAPIKRTRMAGGRGMHWCPKCQR